MRGLITIDKPTKYIPKKWSFVRPRAIKRQMFIREGCGTLEGRTSRQKLCRNVQASGCAPGVSFIDESFKELSSLLRRKEVVFTLEPKDSTVEGVDGRELY